MTGNQITYDELLDWPGMQRRLAAEISALRLARRVKQADLARMAGVSRSTLSHFEQEGQGTVETLLRVLSALDALGQVESLLASMRQARDAAQTSFDDLVFQDAAAAAPRVRRRVKGAK